MSRPKMHGHRQRQRAERDHVVHDHRDGVLRDVVVVGTRRPVARYIASATRFLVPEPLFDVREEASGVSMRYALSPRLISTSADAEAFERRPSTRRRPARAA